MDDKKNTRVALIALLSLDFGARSISAFLKKNGYPVSLIFFNRMRCPAEMISNDFLNLQLTGNNLFNKRNIDLLISLLKKLDAKIIGISLTAITFQTAKAITLEIKKHLDVKVVWGGIHPIVCPEECIRYADIVCVGEGELPMLELAEKLENNEPICGIGNLWIKNTDGIEKNKMNPLMEDLDRLPFPDFTDRDDKFVIDSGRIAREYEILSGSEKRVYPIMTSRGCMYACSFCSNSILKRRYEGKGNYLRRRSVGNVIDELKYAAANRQFSSIRFWDDVFTYDARWIGDFCDQYLREIGKPFSCYTHPLRTDKEILLRLRNAGLITANIGIQSGSEGTSKNLFSRVQSNRDILDFALFADKSEVTMRYDIIGDNPYETDQDEERTAELLMQLPYPFQVQFYSLCWFPETPLTKKALDDKIITARDLEQNTSKALDNFFMYVSLSPDKRSAFWNCIKSMATNRLFSVHLIRLCMKSRFLKKHPRVLFTAGKWYLNLFSKYGLKLTKNAVVLKKKIACHFAHKIIHMDRDLAMNHGVLGAARWLFQRPAADYSFFPVPGSDGHDFCLRIRNYAGIKKTFDFVVLLAPFGPFLKTCPHTRWGMRIYTSEHCETDVRIKLDYPELTCSIGGNKGITILRKKEIPSLISGKSYMLLVTAAEKPHVLALGDSLIFKA